LHNPISFTGLLAKTTKADTTRAKPTQAQNRLPNRMGVACTFDDLQSEWRRSFGNKMKPADLISEARAKIIWGEPSSSVRSFLTAKGISDIEAEAAIKQFDDERNSEIRSIGIKKTFIGAALTIGAGVFFYWSFKHVDIDQMNSRSARGFVTMVLVIAIGGFYGLWKLMDGITYLVRPRSVVKSISDIS